MGPLLLFLLLTGCSATRAHPHDPWPLRTGSVEILTGAGPVTIAVEVARTRQERRNGLSGRAEVPMGTGMLFRFDDDRPGSAGFWMYRTRVPLTIAFLDADGVIVAMLDMEPCRSPIPLFCRSYRPGRTYRSALEVPRGDLTERGVRVGDRVRFREAATPGME